jgi:hypothetical protein
MRGVMPEEEAVARKAKSCIMIQNKGAMRRETAAHR